MKSINKTPQDTQQILEARARLLARQEDKETDGEILELATFSLGKERYGIKTICVHEIQPLKAHHWSIIPSAPNFIVGVINLRGRIYSIMNIARFLGLPEQPISEKAHILLVRGGLLNNDTEMELAFLADRMPELAYLPLTALTAPPSSMSNQAQEYTTGVSKDSLIVLNLDRMLSDQRIIVQEEI